MLPFRKVRNRKGIAHASKSTSPSSSLPPSPAHTHERRDDDRHFHRHANDGYHPVRQYNADSHWPTSAVCTPVQQSPAQHQLSLYGPSHTGYSIGHSHPPVSPTTQYAKGAKKSQLVSVKRKAPHLVSPTHSGPMMGSSIVTHAHVPHAIHDAAHQHQHAHTHKHSLGTAHANTSKRRHALATETDIFSPLTPVKQQTLHERRDHLKHVVKRPDGGRLEWE